MELTDTQRQTVAGWAKDGLGLSEIQKKLESELGINMTYMDVRLLVLEIGCAIKDRTQPKEAAPKKAPASVQADDADEEADYQEEGELPAGGASVEIDRVVKAGAVVSGTVVFSDGVKAAWAVDNLGRMVLDPGGREGYRPTEADIRAFQEELKRQISRRGY